MSIHSPGGSTLANALTNVISETLTLSSESFMTSAVVFSIMLLTSNVVIHKQRNKVTKLQTHADKNNTAPAAGRQGHRQFLDTVVRALCIGKNVTNFTDRKNGGLTLWKTGCYWAEEYATSQLHCCSCAEVNKFLLAYVIYFKRINFPQYFASLSKRIFNCCNVLMLSWSLSLRSNNKRLSPRYYLLIYGHHFPLVSYCDITSSQCGGGGQGNKPYSQANGCIFRKDMHQKWFYIFASVTLNFKLKIAPRVSNLSSFEHCAVFRFQLNGWRRANGWTDRRSRSVSHNVAS